MAITIQFHFVAFSRLKIHGLWTCDSSFCNWYHFSFLSIVFEAEKKRGTSQLSHIKSDICLVTFVSAIPVLLFARHLIDIPDFIGTEGFVCDRELATVVLSCYVDQPFARLNFKNANRPFFQSVYKVAVTLNRRMAEGLECCIAM